MHAAALCTIPVETRPGGARELTLAEPGHSSGFLPIYLAEQKGYFRDVGIELNVTAMGTLAFVNAVLTGDAFTFLGSVEDNALAKVSGKEQRAVVDLDSRVTGSSVGLVPATNASSAV